MKETNCCPSRCNCNWQTLGVISLIAKASRRHAAGFIALATASSGVAASILPGGRTTHLHFKIPVDIDDNFTCNISKQSSLAILIRDPKLIVWDEVSVTKKT